MYVKYKTVLDISINSVPIKYAHLILSERVKKFKEKRAIKNILTIIFNELKTEVTLPIRLLGTLLNK